MFLTVFSTLSCSFNFGLKFLEPLQLKFEESTTVRQCPFKNAMLFCSPPNAMLKIDIRKIFPPVPHCMWGGGKGLAGEVVFMSGLRAKAPKVQICPKSFATLSICLAI